MIASRRSTRSEILPAARVTNSHLNGLGANAFSVALDVDQTTRSQVTIGCDWLEGQPQGAEMARPLALGPTELNNLGDAFEAAWLALLLADGNELMDGPAVRSLLAKRIMEAAANGEIDPTRLKEYALEGVLGPSRAMRIIPPQTISRRKLAPCDPFPAATTLRPALG